MPNILETIVNEKHYSFIKGEETSWQEAVRLSALPLVADGCVDKDYYKQIVDCITKYGPYIVFDHHIAMPHTTENPVGAYKTAIGFMVSENMIDFGTDSDGEKKEANLFFTLSAVNSDEHMENISQLMSVFMNEELIDALAAARTPEDIIEAMNKYPCDED